MARRGAAVETVYFKVDAATIMWGRQPYYPWPRRTPQQMADKACTEFGPCAWCGLRAAPDTTLAGLVSKRPSRGDGVMGWICGDCMEGEE